MTLDDLSWLPTLDLDGAQVERGGENSVNRQISSAWSCVNVEDVDRRMDGWIGKSPSRR